MGTKTYDFRSFCRGELVRTDKKPFDYQFPLLAMAGAYAASVQQASASETVSVIAQDTTANITIDHAFDPVIVMLQQMAFPVATICIAWACLEAMIGKPASAVSRAKWAALGYIAMRYVPDLLRHI